MTEPFNRPRFVGAIPAVPSAAPASAAIKVPESEFCLCRGCRGAWPVLIAGIRRQGHRVLADDLEAATRGA